MSHPVLTTQRCQHWCTLSVITSVSCFCRSLLYCSMLALHRGSGLDWPLPWESEWGLCPHILQSAPLLTLFCKVGTRTSLS